MIKKTFLLSIIILIQMNAAAFSEDLHINSPRNKGTLRFEIDNDSIWNKDSNFSNGWSIQYHSVRYEKWEDTKMPWFIKWVGENFPTLGDEKNIVRNGQGIGQNMITPGDLTVEVPQDKDLPYAGTLTYTFNWQSFNRNRASNLQISMGVLGEESMADDFQETSHNEIFHAVDPKGWETQRKTEPIFNVGYERSWRVGYLGNYTNDWAMQLSVTPSASVGNLLTAFEMGIALRFGWNILEGFNAYPAPPGRGFFQASSLPKPAIASPHGFEVVLGLRLCSFVYSVIYDGSYLTDDERSVERNDFIVAGGIGIFYHYCDNFSLRFTFQSSSELLKEESLPEPYLNGKETNTTVSYGTIILDFHF